MKGLFKRIISVICALSLMLTPVTAFAEEKAVIKVETASGYAGSSISLKITAENLANLATLDLDIFYDSSVLTLSTATSGFSGASAEINTNTAGNVKMSMASTTGFSGSMTVLTLNFTINSSALAGDYNVFAAVGDAYDINRNPLSVSGGNGKITVKEMAATTPTSYFSCSASNSTLEKDQTTTLTYTSYSLYNMATGKFEFYYDESLFEFVEFKLRPGMETSDSVYSVNSDIPGYVCAAYSSSSAVKQGNLFDITFKVINDCDAAAKIEMKASSLYAEDRSNINGYTRTKDLTIKKKEVVPEEENYPDFWISIPDEVIGDKEFEAVVKIEGSSNAAAGDFYVNYNTEDFSCVSVRAHEDVAANGGSVIISPKYSGGQVKFSFVNENGASADQGLVVIKFLPLDTENSTSDFTVSGVEVYDPDFKKVSLDFKGANTNIVKKAIIGIELTGLPNKLEYNLGEALDISGAKLTVIFNNEKTEVIDVTEEMVTGFDGSLAGDQNINVNYEGFYDSFVIHCHNYEPVITPPTETEQGFTTHTCTICGDSYVDSYTEATGFASTEEAVIYLREEMVARKTEVTIKVNAAVTDSQADTLVAKAVEHTGVPNEGDYIRFNMDGYSYSISSAEDENGTESEILYTFRWLATAEQEAEVDAEVEKILEELNLWDKTDYEKIKGAYDWVTENVQYDFEHEDDSEYTLDHSTYSAAVQKVTVCQGYATLYYRLMLELGVDCRYIRGVAGQIETGSHAWNIVCLEGKYYNMDPTWDRDLMGHYRWFLCTESNFGNHSRDGEYSTSSFNQKYPMATVPYVFNVAASGTLSNGMEWVLDGDTGTLTVVGTGAIPSYRNGTAPWYAYRESVKSIVVSEGITEVGERAFYWCTNCTSVSLPESLTAIREYGFNNLRALETIDLPENLKTLEFCAFSECAALKSIVIPDSVTNCGSNVFSNCPSLEKAVIGKGLKRIPSSMFGNDRKLWDVTFPEGLTYIDDTAFINCGITDLKLPASLTGMGDSVFAGCYKLMDIKVEQGNTVYKSINGVLFSADGKRLIQYPAGDYYTYYTVPSGTEIIGDSAFRDADNLQYVYFPSTLKEIEDYAFSYCSNLWEVTFTAGITKIGDSAFRSCRVLHDITFKNPNVILEPSVFAECDLMEWITLPANLKEIPNGLFYGCGNLYEIEIPSTVTKIGSSAFLDCDKLYSIVVPGSVKTIGQQAFDYCDRLGTITLEEGVQTIGWIAIRNCPNLTKVVIPDSVTTFEKPYNTSDKNFDGCPNVTVYVNCNSTGYYYAINNGIKYSLSHPYTVKTVIQPTCTAQGYTINYCKCGASQYKSNYVAAKGHSMGSWYYTVEPTCNGSGTERRNCANCSYYETRGVMPTGHSYELVTTAPTCTEKGYTTHTCSVCGNSYVDNYVNENGHSFGEWTVTKEPDCTEKGEERRDCKNCDHFETRPVDEKGHDYENVVTQPTCTEKGFTTHTCSVCGDSYVDSYVGEKGHDYEEAVTLPTCVDKGFTTHTCSGCGDSYVDNYISANGHSFGEWTVTTEPNCTEKGEERRDCENCDHFEIRAVDAKGHDYKAVVTQPTCTEKGFTTHSCSACGDSYTDSYVTALGHKYGEWVETKAPTYTTEGEERRDCENCEDYQVRKIAVLEHQYSETIVLPTCTEKGYTIHSCAECGDSYIDTYVDAKGHDFVNYHSDGNAKCTVDGTKTAKCENCDETDSVVDKGSATGHSFGEWTVTKEPDCTEKGEERRDCENCDHFEIRAVDAKGHDYKAVVTQPTCTEKGFTTHTCSVCGDSYVDSYADAKGHSYEAATTNPTCTEKGFTTHTCSVCGNSYVDNYVSAKGHSFGEWYVTKEATCTEKGEERRDCENCDHFETRAVDAKGHDYEEAVTPPTCTEKGFTTYTCSVCGDSYVDNYVSANGHSFGEWTVTKEPSCTEKGEERRDCENCDHFETRPVDEKGHDYQAVETPPTCTEKGFTTYTCSVCGDTYVDNYVNENDHSFGEWTVTKEPDCTEKGEERRDCENCDHFETKAIDAKGHDYKAVVTQPTCTEKGFTTHTCSVCGDSYVDNYVDANGHSFGEWTVTKEPDCTEKGEERRDCENCDHFETRVADEKGHDYKAVVTQPTCTEKGFTTYTCSVCGDSYVDNYVDARDHDFKNGECVVCGEKDPFSFIIGDVNEDGLVNARDSQRLYEHLVGKKPLDPKSKGYRAADVNSDGMINARDSQRLYEHLVGKKPLF